MSWVLRSHFGGEEPPQFHSVSLWRGGAEVSARGYARQEVRRGLWRMVGGEARATVRFGPFVDPVVFDSTRIHAGKELITQSDDEGDVALRAGMSYEVEVVVQVV